MEITDRASNANALLCEYETVGTTILALERVLTEERTRHLSLELELDKLTRPHEAASPPPQIANASAEPIRTYQPMGYQCRGEFVRTYNKISTYLSVLHTIFSQFPDKRDAIARSLSRHGYTRSYLSEDRMALFPGRPEGWVLQHSVRLIDGWYVDTNLSGRQMRLNVDRGVQASGLVMGIDVVVVWGQRRR